jgi:hypothetical protein
MRILTIAGVYAHILVMAKMLTGGVFADFICVGFESFME